MNALPTTAAMRALEEARAIDTPEAWRELAERLASSHSVYERETAKREAPKVAAPRCNPRLSYGEACAVYRRLPAWFGKKNAAGVIVRPKRATFLEPKCVLVRFADGEVALVSTYYRAAKGADAPDIDAVVRAERGARMRRECLKRKIPGTDVTMLDGSTKRLWLCEIPDVIEAREVENPFGSFNRTLAIGGACERPEFVPVPEQAALDLAA